MNISFKIEFLKFKINFKKKFNQKTTEKNVLVIFYLVSKSIDTKYDALGI